MYQYRPWLDDEDPRNILFVSAHMYKPATRQNPSSFYPGTGADDGKISYLI